MSKKLKNSLEMFQLKMERTQPNLLALRNVECEIKPLSFERTAGETRSQIS